MDPIKIDVSIIARDLKLAPQNVEAALNLLDQGNTIPFVTRFRKDLTGGLNENQLLEVKKRAAKLRALADKPKQPLLVNKACCRWRMKFWNRKPPMQILQRVPLNSFESTKGWSPLTL